MEAEEPLQKEREKDNQNFQYGYSVIENTQSQHKKKMLTFD